ncbi:MAG: TolC family protein [Bdellovibrio sp.]|nr:TolC family protein [Bdellovibrio sp.]
MSRVAAICYGFCLGLSLNVVSVLAHEDMQTKPETFKSLAQEFVQLSQEIFDGEIRRQIEVFGRQGVDAELAWNFQLSSTYLDNDLDSSTRVNTTTGKTWASEVALAKPFSWGGQLTFSDSYTRSEKNPATLALYGGGANPAFENSQTLTYSQDFGRNFLGKTFRLKRAIADLNIVQKEIALQNIKDETLLQLYEVYIRVRLGKSLVELQQQALQRAQQRADFIARRMRDGLAKKAEYLQALMALSQQEEQVRLEQAGLRENLKSLHTMMRRHFSSESFMLLSNVRFRLPVRSSDFPEKNYSYQALLKNLEQSHKRAKMLSQQGWPDLKINLSTKGNDYDAEGTTAFNDGTLSSSHQEKAISFALNYPLGNETNRLEIAKTRLETASLVANRDQLENQLRAEEQNFHQQITFTSKNIESSKRRVELGHQAVVEYNQLYRQGKTALDTVLRADEDLITAEKRHGDYLAQKKLLLGSLALLYGQASSFLLSEED